MEYKERYKKYRPETQEQLANIIKTTQVEDAYLTVLDLLALNFDMLFDSADDIKVNGYEKPDAKGRIIKNHALQTFSAAQLTIIKLLNTFPSNPLSKAKLSRLVEGDEDDAEILGNLLR